MITLSTGLPGNGKTLFMLWYIQAKAKKENREVYYHNVKNLNTDAVGPWMEFDPENWMDLPHGSIILIDECQEVFPRKPNGAVLPGFYSELAKHRHKGFDIFLVTQHPTLIDNFVRRLVGQHFHSVRKFGLQRSTVYEWSACQPAPETVASHKSAVVLKWKYPKEVFGWYKSAEVHTVKRSIPAKLVLAILFVFSVIGVGVFVMHRYKHRYDKPEVAAASAGARPGAAGGVVGSAPGVVAPAGAVPDPSADPVADLKRYAWEQTPRVTGLPQTAPKYDELTKPTRVPVPAMCVQIGTPGVGHEVRCKCYTQQATPMNVEFGMCMEFARNGVFRDFDPDRDRQQVARTEASTQVLASRPDSALPDRSPGSTVLVMPGMPMGVARDADKALGLGGTIQDGPPNNRATRAAAGARAGGDQVAAM